MRVELMLMIAGDWWHDYMQVEYSAYAPKFSGEKVTKILIGGAC